MGSTHTLHANPTQRRTSRRGRPWRFLRAYAYVVVAARTGRLSQEDVAVAGGRLGVLVDSDDDRLHMLLAPAFATRASAELASLFSLRHRLRLGLGLGIADGLRQHFA
jgi:hypothetical protein